VKNKNAHRFRVAIIFVLSALGLLIAVSLVSVHVASADDKCTITKIAHLNDHAPKDAPDQYNATQAYAGKDKAVENMKKEICNPATGEGDPNILASFIEVHKYGVSPETAVRAQKTADGYVKNKDFKAWNEAAWGYMNSISGFDTVEEKDGGYDTFGEKPGNPPTLTFVSQNHPAGWVLIVHYKDGSADDGDRILCGDQPRKRTGITPSSPPHNPQPNCKPSKSNNYCGSGGTPNCKTNCSTSSPPKTTCENSKKFGPGYFGTYPNCTKGAPPGTGSNQDPSAPGKLPSPADTLSGQCWLDGVVVDEGTPGAKCH